MSENKKLDPAKSWCLVSKDDLDKPDKTENGYTSEEIYVENELISNNASEKSNANTAQNSCQNGELDGGKTALGDNNSECSTEFDVLEGFQYIHADIEAELHSDIEAELHSEIDAELHPEIDAEVHPEVDAGLLPEVDAELHPEVNAELPPEVDAKLHPEVDAKLHPEVDAKLHPEVDAKLHPEVNAKLHPEVNAKLHPEVDDELHSKSDAEVDSVQVSARHWSAAHADNNSALLEGPQWLDSFLQEFGIEEASSSFPVHEFPINGKVRISRKTQTLPRNVIFETCIDLFDEGCHFWYKLKRCIKQRRYSSDQRDYFSEKPLPSLPVLIFALVCQIMLMSSYAYFLYSGFLYFRQSNPPALHEIQDVITTCFGEQYQIGLISGNRRFLNYRVCVYEKEEYTTRVKNLLDKKTTDMLLVGLNNPKDPSFLSFAADSEVLDINAIIYQLQFYKLLPVKEDGPSAFKEQDNQAIAYSELSDDTIAELINTMVYLTKNNELLKEQIKYFKKYFDKYFDEDLTETLKNIDRDAYLMDWVHRLTGKPQGEQFEPHFNDVNSICFSESLFHKQEESLKATKDEHEAKLFTDTTILKSLAEILDMHHTIVSNFCEFNTTLKKMMRFVEILNFTSDVNDDSTWETVSNHITSYLKTRQEAIYDFFQKINDGGFIQWFLKSLEAYLKSVLDVVSHPFSYLKQCIPSLSKQTLHSFGLGALVYIFIYAIIYIFKFYILPRWVQ